MSDKRIIEYGAEEGKDLSYVVIHGFLLKVRNGPPVPVDVGSIVLLTRQTAITLLASGWVMPVGMPEQDDYEVLKPFCFVSDGEYITVSVGDVLTIGKEDAIRLMMEGKIRPLNREAFYPWRLK